MPKGTSENWEIYPDEDWNHTFYKNGQMTFKENKNYDSSKPSTPENIPCFIELNMKKADNWNLDGNNVSAIYAAECNGVSVKQKLIPTAFTSLKISVFPKIEEYTEAEKNNNNKILQYINRYLKKVPVVQHDKKYYLRIAYMLKGNLKKISQELIFG